MSSSPKAFPVSAKHAALWVNHFAVQPGVCFVRRTDGSAFISAWPSQSWTLSRDPAQWADAIEGIRETERNMRGREEASAGHDGLFSGGLIGVLNYGAGEHAVAGFRSTEHASGEDCLGWVGHFDWALNLPRDRSDDALLLIRVDCDADTRHQLQSLLQAGPPATPLSLPFQLLAPFKPLQTPETYRAGVSRILELIRAGDCYQVNLSQKYESQFSGYPFQAFMTLLEAIPVPHAAYVDAGSWQVLSISPERYLRIDGKRVESKPIKGTRPRGQSAAEDKALRQALTESLKDRAENLMIVDLIRNDLSRFCTPYSVKVPTLFDVESYRNVHQLVSTVIGELKEETLAFDALLSAFPGGSITGAPKRRAMEIIDELEPHERGPYCGSVFWISDQGQLDSNIAIRTLMTESDGRISCWGGGGIVADSDPEAEFQESVTKVQRLMETLETLNSESNSVR